MPRLRFTVRRMMVAVAIAAIGLGVAMQMRSRARYFTGRTMWHSHYSTVVINEKAKIQYHLDLWFKYQWAADYPWLPVMPDPPEPE